MTSADIIKRIMNIWATDEGIQNLCLDAYGVKPKYRGFADLENPLSEEDFPLISFYGSKSAGGMVGPVIRHEFLVGFAVSDAGIETDDDLRTESSVGLGRVQQLRDLAERALLKAHIGKITWEGEEDPLTSFPVFTAMTTITVEMQNIKTRI